jgi:tRNA 2-selenouridine synthase
MKQLMDTALDEQQQGKPELHKEWIAELLTHYYDPMYEYQLEKKQHRIQFCGSHDEIMDWLCQQGFVFA